MFKRSHLFTFLFVIACALPTTGFTRMPSSDDVRETSTYTRTPANIVVNHKREPASQVYVPFLILLAIPFGIWMLVSKQKKIARELEAAYKEEDRFKEAKKDDDDFTMPKAS